MENNFEKEVIKDLTDRQRGNLSFLTMKRAELKCYQDYYDKMHTLVEEQFSQSLAQEDKIIAYFEKQKDDVEKQRDRMKKNDISADAEQLSNDHQKFLEGYLRKIQDPVEGLKSMNRKQICSEIAESLKGSVQYSFEAEMDCLTESTSRGNLLREQVQRCQADAEGFTIVIASIESVNI